MISLKSIIKRAYTTKRSPLSIAFKTNDDEEVRYRTQKNPKIPSIANLKQRWTKMDALQQDDVIAYLEDKMQGSWHDMTMEEKRAAYYIWFGEWGPRSGNQDMGNMYLYFGGSVVLTALGLAIYKHATYDKSVKIKGLDYSK